MRDAWELWIVRKHGGQPEKLDRYMNRGYAEAKARYLAQLGGGEGVISVWVENDTTGEIAFAAGEKAEVRS